MSILFTLLFIWSAKADGPCQYTLTLGSFTGSVQDSAQVLAHTMTLSRGSNTSICRNYQLYFSKGQANSYQRQAYFNGNPLPYNLYRTISLGNILKDYGDAASTEYVSGPLTNRNTTYTATWYVEVKSKDTLFSLPPGTYTDTVQVNAYAGSSGTPQYQGTRNLTLSFIVPRYAELSLVPESQAHNPANTTYIMDFGEMIPQEEQRADLLVKGNVPYSISASSMNAGVLKRISGTTSEVSYQMSVGSSGWFTPGVTTSTVINEGSGSALAGRRYNLKVRLGTFDQLIEGDYQDTVTFTVTAY